MAAAECVLRSHGLKARLLLIAVLAGFAITATLFVLEYLDYRQTRDAVGDQGERSLLTTEIQRLDALAGDLAAATAPALEKALRERDDDTVRRIASALLENHATVAVRVLRPDGTLLSETQRSNAWASTLTAEEQRTVQARARRSATARHSRADSRASGSALVGDCVAHATAGHRAAQLRSQGVDHRRGRRADHADAGNRGVGARAAAGAPDRRADPLGRAHRRRRLHAAAPGHEQRRDRRPGSRARSHAAEAAADDDHEELPDDRAQQHERRGAGHRAERHRQAHQQCRRAPVRLQRAGAGRPAVHDAARRRTSAPRSRWKRRRSKRARR